MYIAPEASASDDDSSPLPPDAAAFAAVPTMLRPALERRGFTGLTAVQSAILAADDGRRDLRITSQTGSGKTVALGFVCHRDLADPDRDGPTTLVIAPTRELAAQVNEELSWLFADVRGVRCEVVTGGTSITRERQQLHKKPTVIVGTPGRLLDHIRNGALVLKSVRQLVLDEADQMLDLGFKDELDAILQELPAARRTHLVSATFPAAVKALADRFQRDALLVAGTPAGAAHGDIEHVALKVGARDHYAVLVNLLLLAGEDRTLVFVRTREDTQALADKLAGDGFLAMPIHGELAQAQRTRTLQAFKRGTIHTLIATDVAARGLDIADVTAVVNVDPPIDAETYVHRSGRTGRAGQKGTSYMLVMKSREMRMRRLYQFAKVTPKWIGSPGAEEVLAHQLEMAQDRVEAMLSHGGTVPPAMLATAQHLLQGRDAAAVVAALLQKTAMGVRPPFEVHGARPMPAPRALAPSAAPAEHAKKHTAPAAAGSASSPALSAAAPVVAAPIATPPPAPIRRLAADQRGRAGAAPSWQKRADRAPAAGAGPSFTRFRINWGKRDGADPRRVMAHVCRRGHLESHMVGAINVQFAFTVFEVSSDAVDSFLRSAKKPDRRDPHLVIEREGSGGRG